MTQDVVYLYTLFTINLSVSSKMQHGGILDRIRASQVVLVVKNMSANAGDVKDVSLVPGLGRSPGGRCGNPLQYSCLENSMDRGAWWATVHGVQRVGHD